MLTDGKQPLNQGPSVIIRPRLWYLTVFTSQSSLAWDEKLSLFVERTYFSSLPPYYCKGRKLAFLANYCYTNFAIVQLTFRHSPMNEIKTAPFPIVIGSVFTPHIASTIFNLLEKETQLKSRSVSSHWKDVVDFETTLWTDPKLYRKAAREGNLEIVKKIIESPRTPDKNPVKYCPYPCDDRECNSEYGSSPLHIAAYKGNVELCQLIMSCLTDKNPADQDGNTVLHEAARAEKPWRKNPGGIQVYRLVMAEVDDKNPKDKGGCTPLHEAAWHQNLDLCQLILENVKDKNPALNDGRTPLHFAATKGNPEVCQLILENIEIKNPADDKGKTPLHSAAERGHLDVFKLIMENVEEKNPPDENGTTPLHLAGGKEALSLSQRIRAETQMKYIGICRLILKNVQDKHPVDAEGRTPLDWARSVFRRERYREVLQEIEKVWQDEDEEQSE